MKRYIIAICVLVALVCSARSLRDYRMMLKVAKSIVWTPASLEPVAWYKLDNTANDATGNHDGSWSGTPCYTNGVNKQASCYVSGDNNLITVPHSASLQPNNITICIWARTDSQSQVVSAALFGKHLSYKIQINSSSSTLSVLLYPEGSATYIFRDFSIPSYGWYHVAFTYDGSTANLYLDGELSDTTFQTGAINTGSYPLGIGYDSFSTSRRFVGSLDDILIFNRALSLDEIKQIYNWRE